MKVTVGPTSNIVFQPATDRGTSAKITLSTGGGGGGASAEAYGQANSARSQANTARDTANSAYGAANTAQTNALNAYGQANAAYNQANTGYGQANAAYNQANTARTTANNAYDTANLKLNIAGGSITGSLNVAGNLTVSGNTTYINVTTYQVTDSLIYLASNNDTSDTIDIGFIGGKNTAGIYSHTGLARDASDATWYLFDGLVDEGHVNNVIDFANTTLASLRANILANNIQLGGNTVATQANLTLAYNQANAAYGAANNRVLKAGDTMTGNLNVAATLITQNIIPAQNNTFNLGSPQFKFKDLYVGGNTVYIGDAVLSSQDGELKTNTFNAAVSFVSGGLNILNQANNAYDTANNAYGAANNRVLKTGDTMTGTLNINYNGVGLNVNNSVEISKSLLVGNSNTGVTIYDDVNDFAAVEIGGIQGGYIDFKQPIDEDYDFRIYNKHAQTEFISANTDHPVAFIGANVSFDTNTLVIDVVNNKVGVGTNTPNVNLEVVGAANVTNTLTTNTVNFGFGVYDLTSNTFQTTSNDLIEVDSFAAAAYSTVKYIVQVKTGTSLHATELFCIQDGVSTYMTEYATLISGPPLGSFSINLAGGRMKLNFNPDNPLNNILTFKVVKYTISA